MSAATIQRIASSAFIAPTHGYGWKVQQEIVDQKAAPRALQNPHSGNGRRRTGEACVQHDVAFERVLSQTLTVPGWALPRPRDQINEADRTICVGSAREAGA